MPWLPFYASAGDTALVLEHLNKTDDLAFLVSAGPRKWVAQKSLETLQPGRICLWHVGSGALPLLHPGRGPDLEVSDPFKPWTELLTGANSSVPYFGAGHPGVFWLNLRTAEPSRYGSPVIGLSSFEWIGNHYKVIGNAAAPSTKSAWQALRRWMSKSAKKVPRGGPTQSTPPEIWALPGAQLAFIEGALGGNV